MAQMQRIGKTATSVAHDRKGVLRVTYHSTVVVEVAPNGVITLDHNGWKTVTTKTRMNQTSREYGLGFYVFQKDGDWIVHFDGLTLQFDKTPLVLKRRSHA